MSVAALPLPVRAAGPVPAFLDDIWAAALVFRRRRSDRAALAHAARLGPRLLADMGIAEAVPRPVVGGWNNLRPNSFLVR